MHHKATLPRATSFLCLYYLAASALAPAANLPEIKFSPEELRADFAAMYEGLQSAAYNLFAFTPKKEMDRAFKEASEKLTKAMTLFEAQIYFEKFAALAHLGHARVDFPYSTWNDYLAKGGKAFPLEIRIVDGKIMVAQNASGLEEIARGDEILQLNNIDMQTWLKRTEAHVSAETPYMAHSLMEFDFPIYLWVELGEVDGFDLELGKLGGKVVQIRVPARNSSEMKKFAASQPPGLSFKKTTREAKLLEERIAYLRPGPFYNLEAKTDAEAWDVSSFQRFVDEAFQNFNAAHADQLIIDLRGNPGGDNSFSDLMIAWFADKPFRFFSHFKVRVSQQSIKANSDRLTADAAAAGPISRQYAELYAKAKAGELVDFDLPLVAPRKNGRYRGNTYFLLDRQSYSNTVAVAALVQDYKFGVILGEETSDMATTYGAMEKFKLPRTGIEVGYPKARIVRPNGDTHARGVVPDVAIKTPTVETPADQVLQDAVAIIRKGINPTPNAKP